MKSHFKEGSEKYITKQIKDYLKSKDIFHWKVWQGLGSVHGVPDIIAIKNGLFIGIEVKGLKGKLSDKQKDFGDKIIAAGGKYIVAKSIQDVCEGIYG